MVNGMIESAYKEISADESIASPVEILCSPKYAPTQMTLEITSAIMHATLSDSMIPS